MEAVAGKKKTVKIKRPPRLKLRSGLHRPTKAHEPPGRYKRARAKAEARKRARERE